MIPTLPSEPRPPVLVLDGEERASLAVVRSLVRAGFPVHVAARGRWALGTTSRGARGHVLGANPLLAPREYAFAVGQLAEAVGAALVVPVTDASAEAVLEHRHALPEGVLLPFPSREVYRAASDKLRVSMLANECGIGIEETAVVQRAGDPAPEDARLYPGYLKPHRSVVGQASRVKTGVRFVADRAACDRVLEQLNPAAFPVLVQRQVHGSGEGVFLARWGGTTIARFAHRRLREKPPAGGVSVYRESVVPDASVLNACEQLLDALNWEGVAMIEGKRDEERGGWRVMEINGRFWGSLQLAIDAGVDFPTLLVRAVLGAAPLPAPAWREGVRLRWEWGDIDHLLIRLRRSREVLRLRADAPSRVGALAAFLSHRVGRDRLEVFRWSDPLPFLAECWSRIGPTR